MIRIANAPCSWGALEFDLDQKPLEYQQVLDEMVESGYAGTELGDWGFMPTNPSELKNILLGKNLELLGAFIPVALNDLNAHDDGISRALKTADLMFEAGHQNAFIVLADNNGSVPERTKNAGRIKPGMGLNEEEWEIFAEGSMKIADAVYENFGMRTVFHHHCAGYVETPEEIDKLMSMTDPHLLGLCLDTGHYSFGGGDPAEGLKTYHDRIWHVHFKDYDDKTGKRSADKGWDYFESVGHGVFCELGKGIVNFKHIVDMLVEKGYKGWIVVEQDVLPGMGEPKKSAIWNRNFIKGLGL
jgi:inosose dehydratase